MQPKYKTFELKLADGSIVIFSMPNRKVTLNHAANVAYYWAKMIKNDVISIKPIK